MASFAIGGRGEVRVWCYVDGFNLYNGVVRRVNQKWINLKLLCDALAAPGDTVEAVKYFTARLRPRANDPDVPARQETYWHALRTVPEIEIIKGYFPPARPAKKPLACSIESMDLKVTAGTPQTGVPPEMVRVMESNEKGTDVNLAIHLLNDAHHSRFEKAAVVSADSDLAGCISMARTESGLSIGVLNPHPEHHCNNLRSVSSFFVDIEPKHLHLSLFPDPVISPKGRAIAKPAGW